MMLAADAMITLEQPLFIDKKYFGLNYFDALNLMGTASNYSTIPTVVMTFIGGFIFDIVGRRKTILICALLAGISIGFYPETAPS